MNLLLVSLNTFSVHFFYATIALILIIIIRWMGKHSLSLGYEQLSLFVKGHESPAFNYVFRTIAPIVYLIIVATILYYFKLDAYVVNFYLVTIYYVLLTLINILAANKAKLINWTRQIIYWFSLCILSYLVYDSIISSKKNIIIDFTTFANELWIVIIVFLYQIINQIDLSKKGEEKRKNDYIAKQYSAFKKKYGSLIQEKINNEKLEILFYSIMIYESFNRPRVARIVEIISFKLTKRTHTLGLMQVKTDKIITDEESVRLALDKVTTDCNKLVQEKMSELTKKNIKESNEYLFKRHPKHRNGNRSTKYLTKFSSYDEYELIGKIIEKYNGGSIYSSEIHELAGILKEMFYKESKASILPITDDWARYDY